jgi:hypothetical protein
MEFHANTVLVAPTATPENPGHTGFERSSGDRWFVVGGRIGDARSAWYRSDGGNHVAVPIVPYLMDLHPGNVFGFGFEVCNTLLAQAADLHETLDQVRLFVGDRYDNVAVPTQNGEMVTMLRLYLGIAARVRR